MFNGLKPLLSSRGDFTKGLKPDFGLKFNFGLKFWQKCAKSAGLDLVDFTKGPSPWIY